MDHRPTVKSSGLHKLRVTPLVSFWLPPGLRNTWKLQSHRSHSNRYLSEQQKHPGGWGHAGGMHRHRTNCSKCRQVPLEKLACAWHCHLERHQSFCLTANLGKLWPLVSEQTWVNATGNKTGAIPTPNVMPHKQPVATKANCFCRRTEVLKGAGDTCVA